MITIPNDIVFEEVRISISKGEKITIPLRGTSMLPTLHENDLVTLKPFDGKGKLNRNNVLLFFINGQHILHRFHHKEGDKVVARGDNLYSYEKFPIENIVAVLDSFKNKNNIVTTCDSISWRIKTLCVPLIRFWKFCIRKTKNLFKKIGIK